MITYVFTIESRKYQVSGPEKNIIEIAIYEFASEISKSPAIVTRVDNEFTHKVISHTPMNTYFVQAFHSEIKEVYLSIENYSGIFQKEAS